MSEPVSAKALRSMAEHQHSCGHLAVADYLRCAAEQLEAAQQQIAALTAALQELSQEARLLSVRAANATMTPDKLKALLEKGPRA